MFQGRDLNFTDIPQSRGQTVPGPAIVADGAQVADHEARVTALENVRISAGTGLVGGGDLTAPRTISAGPVLTAYAGGATPSGFVLGIVDSADAGALRSNIGLSDNAVQPYNEGPCTLTLTDSAGNSATMGGANAARYVRIGSLVVVSGTLDWTSTAALSAGSRLRIAGLPVAATAATGYRAAASFGSATSGAFNVTRGEIAFGIDAGNSFVWGTKVSGNNVDGSLTKADIGGSGTLFGFTLSYHA